MFLRDLAGLKVKAGGCGFRNTERRAVFLNAMNNVMPDDRRWSNAGPVVGPSTYLGGKLLPERKRKGEVEFLLRIWERLGDRT